MAEDESGGKRQEKTKGQGKGQEETLSGLVVVDADAVLSELFLELFHALDQHKLGGGVLSVLNQQHGLHLLDVLPGGIELLAEVVNRLNQKKKTKRREEGRLE
jgi:hypothetical protein